MTLLNHEKQLAVLTKYRRFKKIREPSTHSFRVKHIGDLRLPPSPRQVRSGISIRQRLFTKALSECRAFACCLCHQEIANDKHCGSSMPWFPHHLLFLPLLLVLCMVFVTSTATALVPTSDFGLAVARNSPSTRAGWVWFARRGSRRQVWSMPRRPVLCSVWASKCNPSSAGV